MLASLHQGACLPRRLGKLRALRLLRTINQREKMESSFKKAYDKTVAPDGSVTLSFQGQRVGVNEATAFFMLLLVVGLPASCAITYPVATMFGDVLGNSNAPRLWWIFLAVAIWIVVGRLLAFKKGTVLIKPGEGIVFSGKNLPFRDIQTLGTINQMNSAAPKGKAYVSARSHGNDVRITPYLNPDLAEAVADEIRVFYNAA